jgi:hypothetical protein
MASLVIVIAGSVAFSRIIQTRSSRPLSTFREAFTVDFSLGVVT